MILLKHFIFQNGQNLPAALYIKQQLRNDKQELIPEEALSLCTKSDITLRPISLRWDQKASFLLCYRIRHLRNALVRFAGNNTKFSERRLYPVKKYNQELSISVNWLTLYSPLCKDHYIFNDDGKSFTSSNDLNSD